MIREKKEKTGRKRGKAKEDLPAVIAPDHGARAVRTAHGTFDLDDPVLPRWVEERALRSGGYPYDTHIEDKAYEDDLLKLQIELVKLQHHANQAGLRIVGLMEGRDAAGKGGSILAFSSYLNPRTARDVALPKPTEDEEGQWYFQRYIRHLPTRGEIVLFDRSWYNRAGVETVMGFCTAAERQIFLQAAPRLEQMLVDEGIILFKFWLEIGREMQFKRFHERRHNPLKIWKLSPIDYAALHRYDDYSEARDRMLAATDRAATPWTVALANDKRRARLDIIRHVLLAVPYPGRDKQAIGHPDPLILGGAGLLHA